MHSFLIYGLAALAEIAGCLAAWAWLRRGANALWLVPGAASLLISRYSWP